MDCDVKLGEQLCHGCELQLGDNMRTPALKAPPFLRWLCFAITMRRCAFAT